jgi:transposase-like protein
MRPMSRPDFPRTLREFQRRFADEAACRAYLAASRWPDGYRCPLTGFIRANVDPGTIVITDGWQGYAPLTGLGYRHRPRIQGDPARAEKVLPRVHRVFGNLKTWLRGTHHGVGHQHLQAYLDEFTFRFNRRRTPMAAFQTLLGLGTQLAPTTYRQLYAVESTG